MIRRSKSPSRKGFVLIVTSVALTILLAFAALGIDIARMQVIKSELQAFTDAAALSAAIELDGAGDGIVHARDAAAQLAIGANAMKWDMGTKAITGITETFAQGGESPDPLTWTAQPKDAANYRFVRVVASAPAPLVFLRIFQTRDTSTVAASSIAVKTAQAARLIE